MAAAAAPPPPAAATATTPAWCWAVLAAAVFAVSSAGVAFKALGAVPPLTLAGWRLQLTAVLLLGLASVQWAASMDAAARWRFARDLKWSALSGATLAVHFGSWVWSLQHTSLAHSLLLVSTTPVLLVAIALARRQPVALGEGLGSLLALAGCGVLAWGAAAAHERQVTLQGDAAALLAAVAIIGHWDVSKRLRQYQPVFVYAAPVTALAAAMLTLAGAAAQGWRVGAFDARAGAFGWVVGGWRSAGLVVYLAVVPGIIGHQGFNACLKYMEALTVSLAVQLEPLLGSLLGWAAAVEAAPGRTTLIGGVLVLLATTGASVATARRQAAEARAAERRLAKGRSVQLSSGGGGGGGGGDEVVAVGGGGGGVDGSGAFQAPAGAAAVAAAADAEKASRSGHGNSNDDGNYDDGDEERQRLVVRATGADIEAGSALHARHHHHGQHYHHQQQQQQYHNAGNTTNSNTTAAAVFCLGDDDDDDGGGGGGGGDGRGRGGDADGQLLLLGAKAGGHQAAADGAPVTR